MVEPAASNPWLPVLFFLYVLACEPSHSLVALNRGIPVRGITLFIFGGVSQLAHEAQRPSMELWWRWWVPLTSLLLAAGLGGLWYWSDRFSFYLSAVLFTLFAINLSLEIFNLLPGFPLDGGRVLLYVATNGGAPAAAVVGEIISAAAGYATMTAGIIRGCR